MDARMCADGTNLASPLSDHWRNLTLEFDTTQYEIYFTHIDCVVSSRVVA